MHKQSKYIFFLCGVDKQNGSQTQNGVEKHNGTEAQNGANTQNGTSHMKHMQPVSVEYETREGTAKYEHDFQHVKGKLVSFISHILHKKHTKKL